MKDCLFVIDVQESFRCQDYFDDTWLAVYLNQQNALIDSCIDKEIPIVRVLHVDEDESFMLDSGQVIPMQGLKDFKEALCIYKHRHSALMGTTLPIWLLQNRIENIIISGIRTEQCCETTTRHASDLGYKVTFVLDATLTFDMKNANGSVLTTSQIKQRTHTVLQNRFADVVDVQTLTHHLNKVQKQS